MTTVQNSNPLKDEKVRRFASYLTFVVSLILLVLKFYAFQITGSKAIYSDALESIVNVVTGSLSVFVISFAAQPVDENHPYGHGKIEYFSAAFEGGLISFAALFIISDGVGSLFRTHSIQDLERGLFLVGGAGIINLALGAFLIFQGKRRQSPALHASGHHMLSDFVTSIGVVGGVALVKITGMLWIDSVAAIGVGVYLAVTGYRLLRTSASALLDEEDEATLAELSKVFTDNLRPGIIQIHHVKVIRSGRYHHIDAHVVLPEFWEVSKVHEQMNFFEKGVIDQYHFEGELNFHMDPCRRVYCSHCDLKNCPIRQVEFVKRLPTKLTYLRSKQEPEEFREGH